MSEQKKHDSKPSHEHANDTSPQKEHVATQDSHHLKEPLQQAHSPQHQPLDEQTAPRNVGQNTGSGRPPLKK